MRGEACTGVQGSTTDATEDAERAILITIAGGGIRSRGGSRRALITTMKRPFMVAAADIGMIAALRTGATSILITTVA